MQTVLIILLVLAGAYFIFSSREGLKWDRSFAGFMPAVSGEINLGSLDVPGDRIDKVAVSDKVIKKMVDGISSKISSTQNLSVFPVETIFIEVFGTKSSIDNLEKERPDVYGAYIKYLEETQMDNAKKADDGSPKKRASLVSYMDAIKNSDVARLPAGAPLTYRTRMLLLETKRYYGIEVDAICMGNDEEMKVVGITTKTVEQSAKIQPFVDELKAGEWVPYADILKNSFGSSSILKRANEAIEAKLKR